ncbi:hypothetical protein R1sor_017657 [Riccia sorocarpa]|uniref:Helicase-associated domain-containing protein n=1 Tax=Riccia sorocarpa TaxID=122646 RepID=A0ABD3IB58_9MARC
MSPVSVVMAGNIARGAGKWKWKSLGSDVVGTHEKMVNLSASGTKAQKQGKSKKKRKQKEDKVNEDDEQKVKTQVANFPFPTAPDRSVVVKAEKCLKSISALNFQTGLLTPLGQAMAVYPISPRHSRMLLAAIQEPKELSGKVGEAELSLAIAYAIAVAAVLSLDDPFLRVAGITEEEAAQATEAVQEGMRHKSALDAVAEAEGEVDIFIQIRSTRKTGW